MTTDSPFRTQHSRAKRIWHWATFIVMSGSLITVLFAKTLFNTRANIPTVQETLQKSNITVSADQAKDVAHEFNDKIWEWHIIIGYVLASLLLFRIIYEFFQPKDQKLIPILKKAIAAFRMPGSDKKENRHYLGVKALYIFFYFALFVQACTGLFMAYSDDVESLQSIRDSVSEVHETFMWVIIGYIVLHLGGVILAELNGKTKGIVSDMINGNKD